MRVFASAFLFTLCVVGAAHGEDLASRRSESVSYSDLNVENRAGAKALYRRLEAASQRVCADGEGNGRMPLSARGGYETCRSEAMERALRSINSPYLTAYAHREDMPIAVAQH